MPRTPTRAFCRRPARIRRWREPAGDGVRVDTGFRAGDTVTPYYDALLAKLIVWAADRPQALARMVEALGEFEIAGVTTNLAFLAALLSHPQVARGEIDTGFIERELVGADAAAARGRARSTWPRPAPPCCCASSSEQRARGVGSPWNRTDGWMIAGRRSRRLSFRRQRDAVRRRAVVWPRRHDAWNSPARGRALRFVAREADVFDVSLGDRPGASVAAPGRAATSI